MIHNTVCSLLLREGKIYREIVVVNMWWMYIIVVALMAFGIFGFVSLVRLFEQRLTSETTRRAEDMYDQYADSLRERHRRSLAPRRYWPVLPNRVPTLSTEVRRALVGPGLWPGPRRQIRWVGRGSGVNGAPKARPREAGREAPLLEGPTRTMRGSSSDCDFRPAIGVSGATPTAATSSRRAAPGGRYGGDRLRPVPGQPCAAAAASAGHAPEGRERSCRPATASPGNPGRPFRPSRALYSPSVARLGACTSLAVRPGAPKVRP